MSKGEKQNRDVLKSPSEPFPISEAKVGKGGQAPTWIDQTAYEPARCWRVLVCYLVVFLYRTSSVALYKFWETQTPVLTLDLSLKQDIHIYSNKDPFRFAARTMDSCRQNSLDSQRAFFLLRMGL